MTLLRSVKTIGIEDFLCYYCFESKMKMFTLWRCGKTGYIIWCHDITEKRLFQKPLILPDERQKYDTG